MPTLRTSEFVVLQLVGLDAAVVSPFFSAIESCCELTESTVQKQLLSFLRTGFIFFLTCTIVAFGVLVPINYRENGTLEGVPPSSNSTDDGSKKISSDLLSTHLVASFRPVNHGSTLYLTSHLVFAYLFTILALVFLHRNWRRYIPLRQLFSLELAHSIPARTVLITDLPPHLRSERALSDYFEGLKLGEERGQGASGLAVESVVVTRAIGSMKEFLERRTRALRTLEEAWTKYLGNPVPTEGKSAVFGYDRDVEVERILSEADTTKAADEERGLGNGEVAQEGRLIDLEDGGGGGGGPQDEVPSAENDVESLLSARAFAASAPPKIISNKKRPTLRPHWFAKKVDALDYYAEQFRQADDAVRKRRRGKFRPTGTAFVTFQSLAAAVSTPSAHCSSRGIHELNPKLFEHSKSQLKLFTTPLQPNSRPNLVSTVLQERVDCLGADLGIAASST
jgi:hypothetical protein